MVDRRAAPHYSWGGGCDGWHLVETPALSVIEERMPPGTSEIRHYHQKVNQFFYVLRGILQMDVEGNELALGAGQGLHIKAGERHRFETAGNCSLQRAEGCDLPVNLLAYV
jgi:mannose-6-phosphate isomerase-like protein (cupin superfamily)